MIDLSAKKEKLLQHVRNDDFFSGGVLANEIPFYIFDYDPKDELALRHLASEFDKELKNKGHNILHINLYELVIELLTEKFGPEKYIEIEKEQGFGYLSEHVVKPKIDGDTLATKITELAKGHELVYFTHLGVARPFLRAHSLLNNLAGVLSSDVVVVLFYPGSYGKKGGKMSLNLFDKFLDDHYYRAFSLCH